MRACGVVIILLGLFIFNSCQKKFEEPRNTLTNIVSGFTAKINGQEFVADIYGATINTGSTISLAAKSSDGRLLSFSVADSGIHVYSLDIRSTVNIGGYIDIADYEFTSNGGRNSEESGGRLAITSIDNTRRLISGTFNLKVFRQSDLQQKVITDGVFSNVTF